MRYVGHSRYIVDDVMRLRVDNTVKCVYLSVRDGVVNFIGRGFEALQNDAKICYPCHLLGDSSLRVQEVPGLNRHHLN